MKLVDTKSFLRIPVIYGIYNTITSKWYIGSCIDLKDRMQRHRYYLRHNLHHSPKLQKSFNKYGIDCFEVHILKMLSDEDDRFKIEEQFIKDYDSVNNGYNMLATCTYKESFKLSKVALSNFKRYLKSLEKAVMCIDRFTGKIVNTFESVSEAARFYKTSSSNISRTCMGEFKHMKDIVFIYLKDFDPDRDYIVPIDYLKGKPKSDEWKQKIRLGSKRAKKVYKYDLNNNLIQVYPSRLEAERQNNFK